MLHFKRFAINIYFNAVYFIFLPGTPDRKMPGRISINSFFLFHTMLPVHLWYPRNLSTGNYCSYR